MPRPKPRDAPVINATGFTPIQFTVHPTQRQDLELRFGVEAGTECAWRNLHRSREVFLLQKVKDPRDVDSPAREG